MLITAIALNCTSSHRKVKDLPHTFRTKLIYYLVEMFHAQWWKEAKCRIFKASSNWNALTENKTKNNIHQVLLVEPTNIKKKIFKLQYEPVPALTLIWLPPLGNFRVWQNTSKTGKIMFFLLHTCRVHGTRIMQTKKQGHQYSRGLWSRVEGLFSKHRPSGPMLSIS